LTCVREALAPGVPPFAEALGDAQLPWQLRHNCALFLREIGGSEAVRALRTALGDPEPKVAAAARDALLRLGELEEAAAAPAGAAADTIVNNVDGTELVRIPAGEFLMGSDDGPETERPQHRVHLDEYYIAKHPLTNAQYRRFLEATGHEKPPLWGDKRFNQPNQPVVAVTWYDAMAYCKWAGLRLPTEREWEKAARGTEGRKWTWGDDPPDVKRCNFGNNVGATTEVGSYPDGASPYGCLEMAGNVWEWCMTKWRESYQEDPDDSAEGEERRVQRGGAWWNDANAVRCSRRRRDHPDARDDIIGFRCAQ
jgi:formylglycine-generating enzyme required for sulfatase activity